MALFNINKKILSTVAALSLLAICIGSLLGIVIYRNFCSNYYAISKSGVGGHGLVYTERPNKLLFDYRETSFQVNAFYKGPFGAADEKTRALFEQHWDDIVCAIVSRYSNGTEETVDVYLKDLVSRSQYTYHKYGYERHLFQRYRFHQAAPAGKVVRIFIPNNEVLSKLVDDYPDFRINVYGGYPRNIVIFKKVKLLNFVNDLIIYLARMGSPGPLKDPPYIPVNRVLAAIAILSFIMLLAIIIAFTLRRRYATT